MAESPHGSGPVLTAREAGLVTCVHCARVWPMGTPDCPRCGKKLVSRDEKSLSRVWAWWVAGLICYIPANIFPMLETTYLGHTSGNTVQLHGKRQRPSVGVSVFKKSHGGSSLLEAAI